MSVRVSDDPINAADALAQFEETLSESGGVVSFAGIVRPGSPKSAVKGLLLQSYSPMTERGIEKAVQTAESRWPLERVCVLHRTGRILTGETIVFVATASAHRRDAFQAADFLMDYLKTEAIFWKKEITESGETWIEPRAQDYTDSDRWR